MLLFIISHITGAFKFTGNRMTNRDKQGFFNKYYLKGGDLLKNRRPGLVKSRKGFVIALPGEFKSAVSTACDLFQPEKIIVLS